MVAVVAAGDGRRRSRVGPGLHPRCGPCSRWVWIHGWCSNCAAHWHSPALTFVGDRGMIKGQQVEDLAKQGFHYITAITKPQIDKLLRTGTLQMGLFDQEVAEVLTDEGLRYVLRRNPVRAQEIRDTRQAKLAMLQAQVAKQNQYLTDHPRANAQGALQKLMAR